MHVHAGEIEEDWFPLYLANGLTGPREMAASEKNTLRQNRYEQDVASGRTAGPEFLRVTAGITVRWNLGKWPASWP
jgi:hypothetical protein